MMTPSIKNTETMISIPRSPYMILFAPFVRPSALALSLINMISPHTKNNSAPIKSKTIIGLMINLFITRTSSFIFSGAAKAMYGRRNTIKENYCDGLILIVGGTLGADIPRVF